MGVYSKLNRDEVIRVYNEILDNFDLTNKDIWLSSGSALVIHGLREYTSDLDMGCTFDTILKVSYQLDREPIPFPGSILFCGEDSIQLAVPEYYTDFYTEGVKGKQPILIEGVGVHGLQELLAQKKRMLLISNRSDEKRMQDIKDIHAICNIGFQKVSDAY